MKCGNAANVNQITDGQKGSRVISGIAGITRGIGTMTQNGGTLAAIGQDGKCISLVGQNVGNTIISMPQKITNYLMTGKGFKAGISQLPKILSMKKAFSDPENTGLSNEGMVKLAEVNRFTDTRLIETSWNISSKVASEGQYQKFYKEIIKKNPKLSAEDIVAVANKAMKIKLNKAGNMRRAAKQNTDKNMNISEANKIALQQIIKSDESIANQFGGFVDEEYRKNVEQRARANIEKRNKLTPEEREKEYEKFKEKLMKDKTVTKDSVQERIIADVLSDPDSAKDIIGEEGVAKLKAKMIENNNKYDSLYQRNLREQANVADGEYLKRNPDASNLDANDLRGARIRKEIQDAVDEAMKELEKQMKKEKAEYAYQQRKREMLNGAENQGLMAANGGYEAQAIPQIYISRTAEEQMARNRQGED